MQRRYPGKEAASRSTAASSATTLPEAIGVRIRGRFARRFGDGEEGGSPGHRCTWTLSNGEAAASGATGFSPGIDSRIAGTVEETARIASESAPRNSLVGAGLVYPESRRARPAATTRQTLSSGIWFLGSHGYRRCRGGGAGARGRWQFVLGPLNHQTNRDIRILKI